MSCNRHFLNVEWEHHSWRTRVMGEEHPPTQETNMWGRTVYGHAVRCTKQDVCEVCGRVRAPVSCVCDPEHADGCEVLRIWRDTTRH